MVKVITRKLVDVSDFLPYPMTALKWWDTFQQLLINASQDIIGCLSSEIKIMFLFWMGCRESNQGEYLSSRMCMSSVRCGERCYLFALWFHIHLMASLVWVQLTKVLTSRRQVDYLIDMWERVWIFGTSLLRPVKSTHILQLLLGFRTSTGWLANPCFDVSDIVGRLRRWTSSRMASFLSGRGESLELLLHPVGIKKKHEGDVRGRLGGSHSYMMYSKQIHPGCPGGMLGVVAHADCLGTPWISQMSHLRRIKGDLSHLVVSSYDVLWSGVFLHASLWE